MSGPEAQDVQRARELAGLLDRIQSDPGGKLDRILEELSAIRSILEAMSAPATTRGQVGYPVTDEQIAAAYAAHAEAKARGIPVHDLSVHVHGHAEGEDGTEPHEHPHQHREGWMHRHAHSHPAEAEE